jgi:hypothetical protein
MAGGYMAAVPSGDQSKAAILKRKLDIAKAETTRLAKAVTDQKAAMAKAKAEGKRFLGTAGIIDAYEKAKKAQDQLQTDYYKETGQFEKLLSGTERDAYAAISALFKSYGLDSLAGKVFEYVKNGYSSDTVSILLQDTKEYKERFSGNEARKKAGLPVLSAGEYLATEASYRQIMESAGLPSGFYDSPTDFTNWIGKNVSPSEIQTRVDLATQATVLANPHYKKALNAMGIADGDLTAYFLDSTKALPYIQKAAATAQIGAAALGQGMTFDQAYAEGLATQGITADQAQQGYAQIAGEAGTLRDLASIYGTSYSQREAEQGTFEGNAAANKKRAGLASRERASFGGAVGTASGGLAGRGGAK